MNFTLVIATRGRPGKLMDTVKRSASNMAFSDSRILVCVDDDDEPTKALDFGFDKRIIVSVKPREDSRGEKYDRALTEAPADIYLAGVDFSPITTRGFDHTFTMAADLFPDRIGVINTPMLNPSFPGLQAMTAKFVEKVGYIYSPEYPFWFIDHEVDDISRMIGRFVFVDIAVDQSSRGPKTIRLRDIHFWADYFDASTLHRRLIARRIIDDLDFTAPYWLKAILRSQFPITEARSFGISDMLRHNAAAIEADRGNTSEPPDEGYVRLKAKAEKVMASRIAEIRSYQEAA